MSSFGPSCIYLPDEWAVVENGFHPEFIARNESVFTVGNGFIGARGFFEEGYLSSDSHQEESFGLARSLYLNGFYDISPIEYPEPAYGYAKMHQAMLSVANPNTFVVEINGERVRIDPERIESFERRLDFRTGLLTRKFIWRASSGAQFEITYTRLASFKHHHSYMNVLDIEALNDPADISVHSQVECCAEKMVDKSDPRVGGGDSSMGAPVCSVEYQEGVLSIQQRASHSFISLGMAVAHRVRFGEVDCDGKSDVGKRELLFEGHIEIGQPFRLEKYSSYFYSKKLNSSQLAQQARKESQRVKALGWNALLEEQRQFLQQYWSECDIEIQGDATLQQGMRFALFQLLQSVGRDGKTNVAAKGLTGEGYGGHYFWDTEIYVIPFFTWTKPEVAKALLRYRYGILNRARERAAELGHRGALFPWRTISGDEASSFFPAGTAQYHINADIAFAIGKYLDVTGDTEMLAEFGGEMLFEIARFFVDLGNWIPEKGFCIHSVTGPDEYTACVDNNAYTNTLAARALIAAREAQTILSEKFPEDWERIRQDLDLQDAEYDEWQRCADGMYVPWSESRGLIAQDDSFLEKPEWDFEGTPTTKYPLLLHYHYLNIYRHQVLKQADTLMLMYLLPEEYSQALTTRCFEYYEPRTTHDSSLSPAVHSAVAANIGKPDYAYEYFDRTARLDLDDFCGNTQDGLHMACLAGSWGALFFGFLGVQIRDGMLRLRPSIPTQWSRVRTQLQFRGRVIQFEITPEEIEYRLLSGEPLSFLHYHEEYVLREMPLKARIAQYLRAVIFDLDGVITDTAEFHYQGWKRLADDLGVPFDKTANERLKGVSRMDSLEHILGEDASKYSQDEKLKLAEQKNGYYRELLATLDAGAVLPGVMSLLHELRDNGVRTAIASSSKNARFILEKLGITELFDEIADGTEVVMSKPDPEVFLLAAKKLKVRPCNCVGVEDAEAGIEAIRAAGMIAVGVSQSVKFEKANRNCSTLKGACAEDFFHFYESSAQESSSAELSGLACSSH